MLLIYALLKPNYQKQQINNLLAYLKLTKLNFEVHKQKHRFAGIILNNFIYEQFSI